MGQDKYGDQVVKTTPDSCQTAESTSNSSSLIARTSAGRLFEVRGYNSNSSDQFIMIFDAAEVPSNSTVPKEVFVAGAEDNFSFTFPQGLKMDTGIVVTNSSGQQSLTIGGNDCWFNVDHDELGS